MRKNLIFSTLFALIASACAFAQTGISAGPGTSITMSGGGSGCGVGSACTISAGGTGATTAPGALTNLGAFPYPGVTGIPFGTSGTASRAATAADLNTLYGFTPQAALGFTPLNPANNLSEVVTPATALKNIGGLGWLTGTGAPAATCSSTVNAGYIYTNGTKGFYQCNNLVGAVYQWNQYGAGVVSSVTSTGTSGASAIAGNVLNIPRYDQFVSLTTTGTNCAAATYNSTTGAFNIPPCAPGGTGTVTTFSASSWPAWLSPSVTNATSTPQLTVAASAIPNSALANSPTINGSAGPFTFNGVGVGCTGATCTFTTGTSNYPWPGKTYYLGTSGSDSNSGGFFAPWLTPNHALNCGDVVIAFPGTYTASNFASGKWGVVTCPTGNAIAWLQCQTFDACKISSGAGGGGMIVSASYWGVQGWEVSNGGTGGAPCFATTPPTTSANIHHIVFANDIANGCGAGGFTFYNNGAASVDYIATVGDIAYNAAQSSSHCFSGISIYQPVQTDTNPGTHIFVAGNFSYGNLDPNPCNGTTPSDGNGAIFDTFDGVGAGGVNPTGAFYTQQAVMENNVLVDNGGRAWEYQIYTKGTPSKPTVFIVNNTGWGNAQDPNANYNICTDGSLNVGYGLLISKNIDMTTTATACTAHTLNGINIYDSSASNSAVIGNMVYTASGTNISSFNDDGNTAPGTTNNTTGTNPTFAAAANPAAPSCAGKVNTIACMSAVISNFTPSAAASLGLGYQPAANGNGSDPLFPQWLCRMGLPGGLVTVSCQ